MSEGQDREGTVRTGISTIDALRQAQISRGDDLLIGRVNAGDVQTSREITRKKKKKKKKKKGTASKKVGLRGNR